MKARNERGVAVITALLIMALAASVASYLAWQQGLWFRQVDNLREQTQAADLSLAGVEWARGILAQDAIQDVGNSAYNRQRVDYLGELWAQHLPGLSVENGQLSGDLLDEQGRFNLNSLVNNGQVSPDDMQVFQRLLRSLQLPESLAYAVVDWIDADQDVQPQGGAEDGDYLSMPTPYRAANRPLETANSLYRIKGFQPAMVARLFPFVSALPVRTAINVNTASPELLAALLDTSPGQVQAIVDARKTQPFISAGDFQNRLPPNLKDKVKDTQISVSSQFFLVNSQAQVGRMQVRTYALLDRGNGGWPKIVWRVRGGA